MGVIRFRAQLQRRGPAAAVVLDDAQVAVVGEGARRFPVVATVNGYTWRTSVARMGGEFLLGLNRAVREAAGVEAGDQVQVTLELDTAPREVEVPPDFAQALNTIPGLRQAFDAMAFTHRKEHVRAIEDAKTAETRARRITKAVEKLAAGSS